MLRITNAIDAFTKWVGEKVMWITSILVLLIFVDVLLRYFISSTKTWIVDLEWHLFALIFLFGAAYALKEDQHVRVDVFYAKWSDKRKAWVNLIGTLIFLIPWCLLIIYTSFQYAENSFAFREGSPDPGGLPARYVIKFAISAGFVLLLLQAIALVLKSLQTIFERQELAHK